MTAPCPKCRPIIMQASSVRGILAGTKTQTRRVMKPQPIPTPGQPEALMFTGRRGQQCHMWEPWTIGHPEAGYKHVARHAPLGQPGDRLWVRETWGIFDADTFGTSYAIAYRADDTAGVLGGCTWLDPPVEWVAHYCMTHNGVCVPDEKWRPSIFMPRWASRITLEITDVRVERVQDISREDAIAEGLEWDHLGWGCNLWDKQQTSSPVQAFERLWDTINARRGFSWESNPWVWAYTFRRLPVEETT